MYVRVERDEKGRFTPVWFMYWNPVLRFCGCVLVVVKWYLVYYKLTPLPRRSWSWCRPRVQTSGRVRQLHLHQQHAAHYTRTYQNPCREEAGERDRENMVGSCALFGGERLLLITCAPRVGTMGNNYTSCFFILCARGRAKDTLRSSHHRHTFRVSLTFFFALFVSTTATPPRPPHYYNSIEP